MTTPKAIFKDVAHIFKEAPTVAAAGAVGFLAVAFVVADKSAELILSALEQKSPIIEKSNSYTPSP